MADSAYASLCVDRLHLWRGQRHVLRGFSFTAAAGDFIHLQGPKGCGKTSLWRTLCPLKTHKLNSFRSSAQRDLSLIANLSV